MYSRSTFRQVYGRAETALEIPNLASVTPIDKRGGKAGA
jgi:hypothetical protein